MYSGTNIILVTNNEAMIGLVSSELVQLRNIDSILIRNYQDAVQSIKSEHPQAIILNCQNSVEEPFCLELIKKSKEITNSPILLLVEKYNPLFVKMANKIGINDILAIQYSNTEILMRTIWSLQKSELKKQQEKHEKLLKQLNVINNNSGFYSFKYSNRVFQNELDDLKNQNIDGVFIALEPNENSRLRPSNENLISTIRKNLRASDTVAHTKSLDTFYLLLSNTNMEGAMIVWNRLNKNIGAEEALCGCIYNVDDLPFEQIEAFLKDGLKKAQFAPNYLYIIDDSSKENANWLEADELTQQKLSKDFKLFRQIFTKKLENIIKPAITDLLNEYEDVLSNTDLPIVETNSSYAVKFVNKRQESEFKITHELNVIKIDSIHNGLDSPENKNCTLYLNDITTKEIQSEFENFILEFKSCF